MRETSALAGDASWRRPTPRPAFGDGLILWIPGISSVVSVVYCSTAARRVRVPFVGVVVGRSEEATHIAHHQWPLRVRLRRVVCVCVPPGERRGCEQFLAAARLFRTR